MHTAHKKGFGQVSMPFPGEPSLSTKPGYLYPIPYTLYPNRVLSQDAAADTVNPDSTYPTIPANGTGPNTYYVFTAGEGLNSATYQPLWVRPILHDASRCLLPQCPGLYLASKIDVADL